MRPTPYRIIEHTADTGFEVRGTTKEKVFEAAALAFFDIMWEIKAPQVVDPVEIEITGCDLQELMVNFLEEFLYLYEAKSLICTGLKVEKVRDTKIRAVVSLQQYEENSDRELLGVKAVTYHQLFIGKQDGDWTARIFLDI